MAGNTEFNWEAMSAQEKRSYLKTAAHDCSFLVGSSPDDIRLIKSYKAILSSASPVFERMFNGDFVESRESEEIKITDAEPDDFQAFLDCITNANNYLLISTVDDAATRLNIFCLSRKYAIKTLEEESKAKLLSWSYFSSYVLFKIFVIAMQIADKELLAKFKEGVRVKWRTSQKPVWSANIYGLDEAAFFEWFTCVRDNYTYLEQFNFVETYAKFNRLERNPLDEGILEKLLKMIRLDSMDAASFKEGPAYSDILTTAEKRNFAKKIYSNCGNPSAEPNATLRLMADVG